MNSNHAQEQTAHALACRHRESVHRNLYHFCRSWCRIFRTVWRYWPCSCLLFSRAMHAVRHSCSSGDGIRPAEPAALSFLACHQLWSSLLIICADHRTFNIIKATSIYRLITTYSYSLHRLFLGNSFKQSKLCLNFQRPKRVCLL